MQYDAIGQSAIQLLGEIGPPARAAIPRLTELAQENGSPPSSQLAAEAIKKIEVNSLDQMILPKGF
jgi:hypothetical protein